MIELPTSTKEELSNIPSVMIRQSLEDLKIIQSIPGFEINMHKWVVPHDESCETCLAGAVMVNRLGLPDHYFGDELMPSDYKDEVVYKKLMALNSFRIGEIESGLNRLGISLPETCPSYFDVANFTGNGAEFYEDMNKLANELERVGL